MSIRSKRSVLFEIGIILALVALFIAGTAIESPTGRAAPTRIPAVKHIDTFAMTIDPSSVNHRVTALLTCRGEECPGSALLSRLISPILHQSSPLPPPPKRNA